jgi:hypothetical protein
MNTSLSAYSTSCLLFDIDQGLSLKSRHDPYAAFFRFRRLNTPSIRMFCRLAAAKNYLR